MSGIFKDSQEPVDIFMDLVMDLVTFNLKLLDLFGFCFLN